MRRPRSWLAAGFAGCLALLLNGAAPALAQAKGDAGAGTGCARYTDPDKRAKCVANEQRAAKTAERKRVDAERRSERRCGKAGDEKARADCEKKLDAGKPR